MRVKKTDRGFERIEYVSHVYPHEFKLLVQQSSAIADYPDAVSRPGSSYLYIGNDHMLAREDVRELIAHLQSWLDTGSLDYNKGADG